MGPLRRFWDRSRCCSCGRTGKTPLHSDCFICKYWSEFPKPTCISNTGRVPMWSSVLGVVVEDNGESELGIVVVDDSDDGGDV